VLGLFLEAMQDVDRFFESDCVNRPVSIANLIFDNLQDRSPSESLERFSFRMLLAILGKVQRFSKSVPDRPWKFSEIFPCRTDPIDGFQSITVIPFQGYLERERWRLPTRSRQFS
jgi:hypothetical protein